MPAKLNLDEGAICRAYQAGETTKSVGLRFGVTGTTVSKVLRRNVGVTPPEEIRRRQVVGRRAAIERSQGERIDAGRVSIDLCHDALVFSIGEKRFLFDRQDEPLLRRHLWNVSTNGRLVRYEGGRGNVRNIYVYHDILGVTPSRKRVVDHINRDVSDNRRANLRLCSPAENARNRAAKSTALSGFKGVCREKNRFQATIQVGDRRTFLGSYRTAEDAARAYDAAALQHFGAFAHLNFPQHITAIATVRDQHHAR